MVDDKENKENDENVVNKSEVSGSLMDRFKMKSKSETVGIVEKKDGSNLSDGIGNDDTNKEESLASVVKKMRDIVSEDDEKIQDNEFEISD